MGVTWSQIRLVRNTALLVIVSMGLSVLSSSAPQTSHSNSSPEGALGWYPSVAEIGLSVLSDLSGVARTSYRIDGSDWLDYGESIVVSEGGNHAVQSCSVDAAANGDVARFIELIEDTVGPEAELVASGTVNDQSWLEEVWYTSNVSIEIVATDDDSGVLSAKYRVDGGDWRSYLSPITISTDGSHTVECYATDVAGNVGEIASATIGIDRVAPVVTVIGFTTEDGVTSMNYVSSDGASCVHHLTISIDGGEAIQVTGDLTSYEFEPLGSGTHNVTVIGYDNAGNSAEASAEFEVPEPPLLTSAQLYASIAIAAAVALAVALFFFMRKRKGKGSAEP